MFGDGLGQGTAKWNYLPNAHNDFIFAIVGEELGFIGAAGLLALFGVFAYTGMRIARRSADPFLRLLTATATAWVVGQVFINVGYVVGLLPVTGIQLPLISAGGTSTAATLFMVGLMANAARHEPDAVAALRAGRDDRMNRLLRLPLPDPYVPTKVEALRDRLRSNTAGDRAAKPTATKSGKSAKPVRSGKAAKPGRAAGQGRQRAAQTTRGGEVPRRRTVSAEAGTARGVSKRSGHHGGASHQRRAAAAQGHAQHGTGRRRRSRRLEGQQYGLAWTAAATGAVCRSCWPVAEPPATSNPRWRSPTHCALLTRPSGSPHWAPRGGWRTGWCPSAAMPWNSSHRYRCRDG